MTSVTSSGSLPVAMDAAWEEEIRAILRQAVMGARASRPRLGSRLARRFTDHGLREDIPELRGHTLEPPNFDASFDQ